MKRNWRKQIRGIFLRLLFAYALICAMLVSCESNFIYKPFAGPITPKSAKLDNYSAVKFTTNGQSIPYWESGSQPGPILLYFHGNGGGLYAHKRILHYLEQHRFQVLAMEYRGYPGAPGKPSEAALVGDAVAFYDHVSKKYPDRQMVIWGYSLGSAIATQLAAQRPVSVLILEAPFSAAMDRAAELFPFVPVQWLMRDRFLTRDAIKKVTVPVFIMHGEADRVIPISSGELLYRSANEPKEFHSYPDTGHMSLIQTPAYGDAISFIEQHTRKSLHH